MGKLGMKRKINLVIGLIVALSLGMLYVTCSVEHSNRGKAVYKSVRSLVNPAVQAANSGDFSLINEFSYYIIDLDGVILQSNTPRAEVGQKLTIQNLSGVNGIPVNEEDKIVYSTPYLQGERQIGTIYFHIPSNMVQESNVGGIVLFVILLIILFTILFYLHNISQRDIFMPLDQIHKVTNAIRKGDLSQSVTYDYDGEVGSLCHDFEALRNDLIRSLQSGERMKKKERQLLAYLSHDLRTPISNISSYAEAIYQNLVTKEQTKEYAEIIMNKTNMLNILIDEILEHSKAKMNEFEIQKQELYSKDFFTPLMEELEKDVVSKGLSWHNSEIPNVLLCIDPKRITEVFHNIVGNSLKFHCKSFVSIEFAETSDSFQVIIKDDGMGISPEDLPFVFQEFFRGEKARTLNVPGSGLGLSIVKYIIEEQGGMVDVDSVKNKGTEIMFNIPVS